MDTQNKNPSLGHGILPRTFREGILAMPKFFDPEQAKNLSAIIQLKVSGEEPGLWYFVIKDRRCCLGEGEAPISPSLTISTPSKVWLQIMRKELNQVEAFFTGQATAEGDFALLLRLGALFSLYKSGRDKDII